MNVARACLLALTVCWAFAAAAEVAVPPLSGRVVDQTGTLSSSDVAALTQTLQSLETRKGSQVAVLIVPTTAPEAIEQYSIRVAEAWKIGRRKIDDGALLVVAKDDRKLRIEVGYGLEGALNDVTAKRIIDEVITPKFRNGDFAGGISAGVQRIVSVIEGEKLPAPAVRQQPNSGFLSHNDPRNHLLLIGFFFIVAVVLRNMLGRLIGSVATGIVVALAVWLVAGDLIASLQAGGIAFVFTLFAGWSSGGGGSWSGGGGWSSGSSDSGGGFSGGGGSFGGGGASGSW
jgi:uncharacterized protein